ncbi:MAG: hypothetical protein M1829_006450 [Trizodia sp. TS-e1964]|nr:MAG: hypothetical protein M1829_006450 [Trizodia sp. TS-e1964]
MSTKASAPAKPYLSNGQILARPPLFARLRQSLSNIYIFFGLYLATLFAFDSYAAGAASSFNYRNRSAAIRPGRTTAAGARGSGGSGGGGGGPDGGRKVGRVDDIRGPECNSCQ